MKYQASIDNMECSNINKNESDGGVGGGGDIAPGNIPNSVTINSQQKNENKIFEESVVEKHEIENEKENILVRKDGAAENSNVVQVNPGDKDGYEFSNHDFTESIGKSVNQEDDVHSAEVVGGEEDGKQFGESILPETRQDGVMGEIQSADDTAYYQTPGTANEQFEHPEQYPADQEYNATVYDQAGGDQPAQEYDQQYDQQYENYGNYEGGEYPYAEGDQQGTYEDQQYIAPEDQQTYDQTYTGEGGEIQPNAGANEETYDDQQNYYQVNCDQFETGDLFYLIFLYRTQMPTTKTAKLLMIHKCTVIRQPLENIKNNRPTIKTINIKISIRLVKMAIHKTPINIQMERTTAKNQVKITTTKNTLIPMETTLRNPIQIIWQQLMKAHRKFLQQVQRNSKPLRIQWTTCRSYNRKRIISAVSKPLIQTIHNQLVSINKHRQQIYQTDRHQIS